MTEKTNALHVKKGVETPDNINPLLLQGHFLSKKKERTVDEYVAGILQKDKIILSQAITLIESTVAEHQQKAQEIIAKCLPFANKSIRIGITGTPGVGKRQAFCYDFLCFLLMFRYRTLYQSNGLT